MRQIKFRAWDIEEKKWIYLGMSSMLAISDDGHLRQFYPTEQGHGHKEYPRPYVLMQYTGLHDKNGKEIYEGDILDGVFAPGPEAVTFEYGRFSTKSGFDLAKAMVIGNIYENPELLNV